MKNPSSKLSGMKESIFATIVRRANELGAVNLSQGSPDFDGPDWLKDYARKSFDLSNQYAPSPGTVHLRQKLSAFYEKQYNLSYDWNSEITIACGATQGIFNTVLALVSPGDEVVVMEPYYDSYLASIQLAGGIAKVVTLKAPDFTLPLEDLKAKIGPKTKLLILNTPHNPSGKVFSWDEMNEIYRLCEEHDVFILSDEVYEFITFDGTKHVPMASIPGAKKRTITLSSAGKTFSMTGWKIGWTLAPKEITQAIRTVHQFNTFCVVGQLQEAVAQALDRLDTYLPEFRDSYLRKRNLLFQGLQENGFNPIQPQGTYFILSQLSASQNDQTYVYELMEKNGVAAIPCSPFYSVSSEGQKLLRFCFAKKDETLKSAVQKLRKR